MDAQQIVATLYVIAGDLRFMAKGGSQRTLSDAADSLTQKADRLCTIAGQLQASLPDAPPQVKEATDRVGLRDQFAMAAMPALIEQGYEYEGAGVQAYKYADAALKAREVQG